MLKKLLAIFLPILLIAVLLPVWTLAVGPQVEVTLTGHAAGNLAAEIDAYMTAHDIGAYSDIGTLRVQGGTLNNADRASLYTCGINLTLKQLDLGGVSLDYMAPAVDGYPAAAAAGQLPAGAFSGWPVLSSVVLPGGLDRIDSGAFENCPALSAVHLPDSLTYLEDSIFSGCAQVAGIHVSSNTPPEAVVEEGAFAGIAPGAQLVMDGVGINNYARLAWDQADGTVNKAWYTLKFTVDPLTLQFEAKRLSDAEATVRIKCTGIGSSFYYAFVKAGDPAPTLDTSGDGTAFTPAAAPLYPQYTLNPTDLQAGACKLYIIAKDVWGDLTTQYSVDVEAYIVPIDIVISPHTRVHTSSSLRQEILAALSTAGIPGRTDKIRSVTVSSAALNCYDQWFVRDEASKWPIRSWDFYGTAFEYDTWLDNRIINCFASSPYLESIVLPSSITNIASKVFFNCYSLKDLTLTSLNSPTVAGNAFSADTPGNIASGRTVHVPYGREAAYRAAPDGNTTDDFWYGFEIAGSQPYTVTSLSISPVTAALLNGDSYFFAVTLSGTNYPTQETAWTVTGNLSPGTTVNSGGWLNVAGDEPSGTLTVTATSVADNTKSALAQVTVTHVDPFDVTISPHVAGQLQNEISQALAAAGVPGRTDRIRSITVSGGVVDASDQYFIYSAAYDWPVTAWDFSGTTFELYTLGDNRLLEGLFWGASLQSIILPGSVAALPSQVFFYCTSLGELTLLSATPPAILDVDAFSGMKAQRQVRVPPLSVAAYKAVNDGNTIDNKWYGFDIVALPTTVTEVLVTPAADTVRQGEALAFTAALSGTPHTPVQDVIWSVSGAQKPGTAIGADGVLTTARDEPAGTLTVTATSAYDTSKSGTATVTVAYIEPVNVVISTHEAGMLEGEIAAALADAGIPGRTDKIRSVTVSGGAIDQADQNFIYNLADKGSIAALDLSGTAFDYDTPGDNKARGGLFRGYESMESILLPHALASVSAQMFEDCHQLGSILLPAGVESIGGGAFYNCYDLGDLTIMSSVSPSVGDNAFSAGTPGNIVSGRQVHVLPTSMAAYKAADDGDTSDNKWYGFDIAALPTNVTEVAVTPEIAEVMQGKEQAFTATVSGTPYTPLQDVIWSVSGNDLPGTAIGADGILTVDFDETATALTVTASSASDSSVTGTATVTVTLAPPIVTSVSITPATAGAWKGHSRTFTAAVIGLHGPSQAVTGGVAGSTNPSTVISSDGVLAVAADESAETLTITATSDYDPSKSGTATVTVTEAPTVTDVAVSPDAASVQQGNSQTFTAVVSGEYDPPQAVTWSVSGSADPGTAIGSDGVLTVADDETAATLTVTATSNYDPGKSGEATVTVTLAPTTVTGVVVSPGTASVQPGSSQAFSAAVSGTHNPSQTVTWSVSGNADPSTAIGTDGVLAVAAHETAQTLTVTATSSYDPSKSGTATVRVIITAPTPPPATKKYTITVQSANTSYGTVSGGGSFASGSLVTVKAVPKAGYWFVRWLEGTTTASKSAEYEFIITKTRTLKAEFQKIGTPGSMKAASGGYDSVKLTWKAVGGPAEYEVYRATSKSGKYTRIGTLKATEYTSTGLVMGKTYYFKVRAKYVAGKTTTYGGYSAIIYAKPVISVPQSVKAARINSNSIKITWGKVPGASGYEIYRTTSSPGSYRRIQIVTGGSTTSYTNTKLIRGKTYYYRVRAYRIVNGKKIYSSFSSIRSAKP